MAKSRNTDARPDDHRRLEKAWIAVSSDLRRYLAFRLGNEAEAQDLAQEAYLRLMRISKPELVRKPHAYLFRIAANLANEHRLKASRSIETEDIEELNHDGLDGDDCKFLEMVEVREQLLRLEAIVDKMPPLYRAILIMRKRDGYSHAEIAERLEISPHTVHTYLKRALVKCRRDWSE